MAHETLRVRPVTRADYDQWLPLWAGYNAFYGRAGATALPSDITETLWERLFDPGEPAHGVVAQSDSALVGIAHYLFHRSTTSIAHVCYLQDLFTSPASRGRGVATALIRRVQEEAARAGSPRLYWLTHEDNHEARRLYDALAQRSGFIVYRMDV